MYILQADNQMMTPEKVAPLSVRSSSPGSVITGHAYTMVLLNNTRCDVNAQAHCATHKHTLDYVLVDTHHYNSMRELRQQSPCNGYCTIVLATSNVVVINCDFGTTYWDNKIFYDWFNDIAVCSFFKVWIHTDRTVKYTYKRLATVINCGLEDDVRLLPTEKDD